MLKIKLAFLFMVSFFCTCFGEYQIKVDLVPKDFLVQELLFIGNSFSIKCFKQTQVGQELLFESDFGQQDCVCILQDDEKLLVVYEDNRAICKDNFGYNLIDQSGKKIGIKACVVLDKHSHNSHVIPGHKEEFLGFMIDNMQPDDFEGVNYSIDVCAGRSFDRKKIISTKIEAIACFEEYYWSCNYHKISNFKKIEILSSNQLLIFLGGIFVVLNKSMHGFTVAPSFGVTTIRSDLFDGEERQFFNISKVLFELTKDA